MKKSFESNSEMKQYFDKLPKFIQESVMQSSIEFHNQEELKQFAENVVEFNG